jgi:hypothetical protein
VVHGPQAVLRILDPGGQIVKIVYDELVADPRSPATTAAKANRSMAAKD